MSGRADIHPTAIVEPGARLGADVRIGPFTLIGGDCVLEDGVIVKSHAVVTGVTTIGAGCVIYAGAVIGEGPQHRDYAGEPTRLEIGAATTIRENVTIHTGTVAGGGLTRVGARCLLMAGCHVAHDARVGDDVVIINHAGIAGHCEIGDRVIIGGLAGIHQFVRVGQGAIIGAVTMVTHDVIPYGLVQSPRGALDGLNLVGLKRRGTDRHDITALRAAYQMLAQGEGSFIERAQRLHEESDNHFVREITAFISAGTDRQFLTPK